MNKNNMRKLLSFILCIVLIAAMALLATGCSDKKPVEQPQTGDGATSMTNPQATKATQAPTPAEVIEKGEGKTAFHFEVTDLDGKTTKFLISTDKTTVGDALLELGLAVEDKNSPGMLVEINGISADYQKDKAYWAFYTNGEYASEGANTTEIDPTATYAFVKTPA